MRFKDITGRVAGFWRLGGVLLAGLILLTITAALAQGPAVPPATAPADQTPAPIREELTLWETLRSGGPVMIPIGALSIVALGLVINYFFTFQVTRLIPKELLRKVYALINENNFQDAIAVCEAAGGFIPTVVVEGLKRRGKDHTAIVQAMEVTGRREADYLRQKIRYLLDISTLEPLLGLLGTVLGMIQGFNVVALDPAVVKPMMLASAIAQALITTAAGLIVAIPSMAFYFYFRGRVQWIVGLTEDICEEFAERITEVEGRTRGRSWEEGAGRMKFFRRDESEEEWVFPMTPMIDMVFLLNIFFLCTSTFYRLEAAMDIQIPSAREAEISQRTPGEIIVNVRKDGTIIVNQRQMTLDQLTDILKRVSAMYKGQAVIVRGDAETRHQDIMNVLDACAQADIWNVSFAAMKKPPAATKPAGG